MTEYEFYKWLEALDLGPLEDVRVYVELHAVDNGEGDWDCAKATVEMYIDDAELAEVFNHYRK